MPKFVKGSSGNPCGRKPGVRNKVTDAAHKLLVENTPAVLQATINCALDGDVQAQKIILGLSLPKRVTEPIKMPNINNPTGIMNALSTIADGVAGGSIDVDQARALVAVIESSSKQIDQDRLSRLMFNAMFEEVCKEDVKIVHRILARIDQIDMANLNPPLPAMSTTELHPSITAFTALGRLSAGESK